MKKLVNTIFACMLYASAYSTNYYVNPSGTDVSTGGTLSAPFKTIQYAGDKTLPGDTVFIMNGTYTAPSAPNDWVPILKIYRSGTAASKIVFINYPGHTPVLKAANTGSYAIIKVMSKKVGATLYTPSYVDIIGLTIQGNRSSIVVTTPMPCVGGSNQNGTGILITGPFGWDGTDQPYNALPAASRSLTVARGYVPHHITVKNCKVFDCTSSGISAQRSDFITIESNEVFDNCWYTMDGTSGINTYESTQYSTDNSLYSSGYQMIIKNNRVYGNKLLVSQQCSGNFYDGNGIIIDDYKLTQNNDNDATYHTGGNPYIGNPYLGKTLIANNLAYNNGGSGFHIFSSLNVDIFNNSTYKNITVNGGNGELYVNSCINVTAKNNVLYAETNKTVLSTGNNTNFVCSNNIGYPASSVSGVTIVDPLYISPGITKNANLDVKKNSPVINQGVLLSVVTNDFDYKTRNDGSYDVGAYEYSATSNALRFDGVDDYVEVPSYAAVTTGANDFTIEARVKFNATQQVLYPTIFSTRPDEYNGFSLFIHTANTGEPWVGNRLWFQMNGNNYPMYGPPLNDGLCHHIALKVEANNILYYLDGVLALSRPVTGIRNITSTGVVHIGHDLPNASQTYMNGEISEVRFWNVPLAATTIAANSNAYVHGATTGLIGYWRLNEGTGQIAYSSATNYNFPGKLGSTNTTDANDPAWTTSCAGISQRLGSSIENPFNAGVIAQGRSYSNTQNNTSGISFGDDLGQVSDDIIYSFTITQTSLVTIDLIDSEIGDTYLRLYNSSKTFLLYNDDISSITGNYKSLISQNLLPGKYYIAVEGYNSSYQGNITTKISVSASTGTPIGRIGDVANSEEVDSPSFNAELTSDIHAFPNPIHSGELYFGKEVKEYSLTNNTGVSVLNGKNAQSMKIEDLNPGIYILKLDNSFEKIIIQ